MHIHIPSFSEATDSKGSKFKVFDIYVNGVYHGSARYSQLLEVHNEVKSRHSTSSIVDFPSKVLMITEAQLHERKKMLERYIHCLAQDREIGHTKLFQDFMLSCQQVSSGRQDSEVEIDIYLSNEKSKKIKFSSYDRAPHVLEATCKAIGIPDELTYYFGLFMEYSSTDGKWTTLHCFCDFQCPYLSLLAGSRSVEYKFRLSIKRWFFSPKFLSNCLSDNTALNMIYIEAISDIDSERLIVPEAIKDELLALKKSGKRKEFVEVLSAQSTFGYKSCEGLIFNDKKKCDALVGGTKIILKEEDKVYPISKLRCWKVGVLRGNREHFFSFEYEYERLKFVWIVLRGVSTILLAQSITRAVEEFLILSSNNSMRKPSEDLFSKRPERNLPSFELTTPPPAGEDIHMAAEMANQGLSIVRTESLSSKESEASVETEEDHVATPSNHVNNSTPVATPTNNTSTHDEGGATRQDSRGSGGGGGGGSHAVGAAKKSKSGNKKSSLMAINVKSKNKEEEFAFNPTFVSDDDL